VYNDIILIFICVFAVYGAYALIRELGMLVCGKNRIVAAIRINSQMCEDEQNDALILADNYISSYGFLERAPIIICDSESTNDLERYGYEVYIRQTEEK